MQYCGRPDKKHIMGVPYEWEEVGGNENELYKISVSTERYYVHETVLIILQHRQVVT
jgi:hypothetical protein